MPFEKPTVAQLSNRYNYHAPQGDQAQRYEMIRAQVGETARLIVDLTPCSPEQARALNALDEAMMLAIAAIARNETEAEAATIALANATMADRQVW